MKTLGRKQFLDMEFPRLALSEKWSKVLGGLPEVFTMLVFGANGHGKTETCQQLALELARFGNVRWVSYETGHSPDTQDAVRRNEPIEGSYPIGFIDPFEESPKERREIDEFLRRGGRELSEMPLGKNKIANRLFVGLYLEMSKPKSAKYWFIDSVDGSQFDEDMCSFLRMKFGHKKGVIWIGHAEGVKPKKAVTKSIYAYGSIAILVRWYRGQAAKNRWNGWDWLIVYEKKAREMDPLFFEEYDRGRAEKGSVERSKKKKRKTETE